MRLKVTEHKPVADKAKGIDKSKGADKEAAQPKGSDPAKTAAKADEPSYLACGGFGKKPVPRSPLQIRWTFKHLVDGVEKEVSVQTGN